MSLSYSDFKYIETSKEDFWKAIRLALTASVSAEFFFYSYLAVPAISPNNPWSWVALPSVFDSEEDQLARNKIKIQRRQNTVLRSISAVMGECSDDVPDKLRKSRQLQAMKLKESLRLLGKSMEAALEPLAPFYSTRENTKGGKGKAFRRPVNDKKRGEGGKAKMCLDGVPWREYQGYMQIFRLRWCS